MTICERNDRQRLVPPIFVCWLLVGLFGVFIVRVMNMKPQFVDHILMNIKWAADMHKQRAWAYKHQHSHNNPARLCAVLRLRCVSQSSRFVWVFFRRLFPTAFEAVIVVWLFCFGRLFVCARIINIVVFVWFVFMTTMKRERLHLCFIFFSLFVFLLMEFIKISCTAKYRRWRFSTNLQSFHLSRSCFRLFQFTFLFIFLSLGRNMTWSYRFHLYSLLRLFWNST